MKPIELISQDVFDKIRSRFQNLEMGDETGAVTIVPTEARFFDFDFVQEGLDLGRVSISLNDAGSLKIYYSQGITENQDSLAKHTWYNFLREMRMFAMRRLLRFDTRDIAKTNLDKNDFQYLATKGSKDTTMSESKSGLQESRWNSRNSKKTSRAVKGATEVIVRHHNPVDEMYAGSRSQGKNIKAIFIQNKDGERFKYPFIHPAGAFAMAQHVDHGGVPHDPAGKAIVKMSEQIAQLQEFHRQVQHASLHDDAMGIHERAVGRLQELKNRINALSKRRHYEIWKESFDESQSDAPMMELDAVTMEQYKDKFTETKFKEEIAKFFPLLHSIMSEENTVDLEDFVKESQDEDACPECGEHHSGACADDDGKIKKEGFEAFEAWAEATEQGKLTDDEVATLKAAIEQLPGGELQLGPDGQTAWQFFSGLGIDSTELEDKFKDMAEIDDSTNAIEVFQAWAQQAYPELLVALGMSGTGAPQEPAPQQGQAPEQPAAENGDMEMHKGTMEGSKGIDKQALVREVAECVMSFYNKDNESVGPFRGEEGIALDVKKKIAEKFGDQAGKMAEELAKRFMEKKTAEWESKHGKLPGPVDQDDGLARLKELVGNIKTKVEGIGDQGQGGRDFNKNIMSSEEVAEGLKDILKLSGLAK